MQLLAEIHQAIDNLHFSIDSEEDMTKVWLVVRFWCLCLAFDARVKIGEVPPYGTLPGVLDFRAKSSSGPNSVTITLSAPPDSLRSALELLSDTIIHLFRRQKQFSPDTDRPARWDEEKSDRLYQDFHFDRFVELANCMN